MKKYFVVLCFLLTIGIAHAQFEGQIDMKVIRGTDEPKHETHLSMFIKQGMLAFSVKGGENTEMGGNVIVRSDKNVLWIVNDKEKTFLEIVPDKEMKTPKKKEKNKAKGHSVLRKTGKSVSIVGYSCDEWIFEDEEDMTTITGTTKLGNVYESFMKAFAQWGGDQLEQDADGWQRELIEKKIFPMKTVTKGRNGLAEIQEVTKVEQRSLSMAMFSPPAGYKKQALDVDMGKMMKGMKDGMKDGNTRSMSKDDLEKMMKQLKESMEKMGDDADSTKEDDEDDE